MAGAAGEPSQHQNPRSEPQVFEHGRSVVVTVVGEHPVRIQFPFAAPREVVPVPRAAYGAALLAGVGAGAWTDVPSACEACIKITGSTQPEPGQVDAYRSAYALYRGLYPALKSSFSKMG